MPPPTPPGVPENVDPETLEPLPVERLLHGLSAQLIGDLTSAAEQDQSLKQPFLEQLVPALSVGDLPEKELLTSSSWRMSDLAGAASTRPRLGTGSPAPLPEFRSAVPRPLPLALAAQKYSLRLEGSMTFMWQAPVAPNKLTCVLGILLNSLQLSELECPTRNVALSLVRSGGLRPVGSE